MSASPDEPLEPGGEPAQPGPLEQEIDELLRTNTEERQALRDQGQAVEAIASVIRTQNAGLLRLARAIDTLSHADNSSPTSRKDDRRAVTAGSSSAARILAATCSATSSASRRICLRLIPHSRRRRGYSFAHDRGRAGRYPRPTSRGRGRLRHPPKHLFYRAFGFRQGLLGSHEHNDGGDCGDLPSTKHGRHEQTLRLRASASEPRTAAFATPAAVLRRRRAARTGAQAGFGLGRRDDDGAAGGSGGGGGGGSPGPGPSGGGRSSGRITVPEIVVWPA